MMDSGQPALGWQGYIFIAVHGGSRINLAGDDYYLYERHDFSVTISIKSADTPRFRVGEVLIDSPELGVNTVSEYIIGAIHGNLDLWDQANKLIDASPLKGRGHYISKAPFLSRLGEPTPVTGQWFGARQDDRGTPCGLSLEIRFGGLEMIRYIVDIKP
ncbi:MAG: hypothetical protein QXT45_05865 [Candidatus Bilamarchaeaceae archaeon]